MTFPNHVDWVCECIPTRIQLTTFNSEKEKKIQSEFTNRAHGVCVRLGRKLVDWKWAKLLKLNDDDEFRKVS